MCGTDGARQLQVDNFSLFHRAGRHFREWAAGGSPGAGPPCLDRGGLAFGVFTPGPTPPEPVSLSLSFFSPPLDTLSRTPGAGACHGPPCQPSLEGRPVWCPASLTTGSVLSFAFCGSDAFALFLLPDFSQGFLPGWFFSSFPNKSRNASSHVWGSPLKQPEPLPLILPRAAARHSAMSSLDLVKINHYLAR